VRDIKFFYKRILKLSFVALLILISSAALLKPHFIIHNCKNDNERL